MRKEEFLLHLENRLSCLPQKELRERLTFYNDLIDDRVEDGMDEEAAIAEFGDIAQLASQIIADTPLLYLVKESVRPKRRLRTWEIVLLIAGSPVWLSLLIAAFAVFLSLYISLWAVVVSLWAVFASLIGTAFGTLLLSVMYFCRGNVPTGTALIGIALVLAGLSVLSFFGCKAATKGTARLAAMTVRGIKRCIAKKEDDQ